MRYLLFFLIHLFTISLHAQVWQWQNPKPTGVSLNTVFMFTPGFLANGLGIGYAGGDNSVLLKTNDFGINWEQQGMPYLIDIMDIEFSDTSIGVILGRSAILQTVNGGDDWYTRFEALPFGEFIKLIKIDWTTTYYAITNTCDIYASHDNGNSWALEHNLSYFQVEAQDFFILNQYWFIALKEGNILRYDASMNLWTIQNCGYFSDLAGITATFNWDTFSISNITAVGSDGNVYSSEDDGETWFLLSTVIAGTGEVKKLYREDYGNLFLLTTEGIFQSLDNGTSWMNICQEEDILDVYDHFQIQTILTGKYGKILIKNQTGCFNSVNTSITGNSDLHKIFFTCQDTGYISGNNGTILFTFDAGGTWQPCTGSDLNGIWSINDSFAIAVGNDGIILKTTNGGETWNIITSGTTADLLCLSFTSPQVGYAAGEGIILKTTNGGQTWFSCMLSTETRFNTMSFLNDQYGFIAGRQGNACYFYKTTDGGQSWTSSPIYVQIPYLTTFNMIISDMQVLSENSCIAAGNFVYWQSGTFPYAFNILARTYDGGASWICSVSNAVDIYTQYHSAFFFNDTTGYVAKSEELIFTTNGGLTWQDTIHFPQSIQSITFTDLFHGYLCGGSGMIAETSDGGITWTNVLNGGTQNSADININNNGTGYAVGKGGYIAGRKLSGEYTIVNAGRTADINDIHFNDNNNGIAVGNYQSVYYTSNAGNTWLMSSPDFTGSHYFAVQTFPGGLAYLCGSQGIILKSTDSGANWTRIDGEIFPAVNFRCLFFLTPDTGWVGGENGQVLVTYNGGDSWLSLGQVSTFPIKKIWFGNPSEGYLIDPISVKKTMNGGISWSENFNDNGNCNFFDLYCFNLDTICAFSVLNDVVWTVNRGQDWFKCQTTSGTLSANTSIYWLSSARMTDISTVFTVGANGTILKSTTSGVFPLIVDLPAQVHSCLGSTVSISAGVSNGIPPYTFEWSTGDTAQQISLSVQETMIIEIQVTDALGNTVQREVDVIAHESPYVLAPADTIIMEGDTIQITATVMGDYTYVYWSNPTYLSAWWNILNPLAFPNSTNSFIIKAFNQYCWSSDTVTVTVIPNGFSVSGEFRYANPQGQRLTGILFNLIDASGQIAGIFETDSLGVFNINNLPLGQYSIDPVNNIPWGGCNSIDCLLILRHFAEISFLTDLTLVAADVNLSGNVNSIDALLVAQRYVGLKQEFNCNDWLYNELMIQIDPGTNMIVILGLCAGDVNGSYIPSSW